MTLEQRTKLAAHIFRLLKVTDIVFPIGRTNKGNLSLQFSKDKETFEVILDAVPLSMNEYDNRELKSILTKYLFDNEIFTSHTTSISILKKKGRPKGSKNKPKAK